MAMGTKNRRRVIEAVGALENFTIGNVRGQWYPDGGEPNAGELPEDSFHALRAVLRTVYVVFSYATPIAWRPAGQEWAAPRVHYSRTTTHHQSLVAQGMRLWEDRCEAAIASRG